MVIREEIGGRKGERGPTSGHCGGRGFLGEVGEAAAVQAGALQLLLLSGGGS